MKKKKILSVVGIFLTIFLLAGIGSAVADVSFSNDKDVYGRGDVAAFTVKNTGTSPIYVLDQIFVVEKEDIKVMKEGVKTATVLKISPGKSYTWKYDSSGLTIGSKYKGSIFWGTDKYNLKPLYTSPLDITAGLPKFYTDKSSYVYGKNILLVLRNNDDQTIYIPNQKNWKIKSLQTDTIVKTISTDCEYGYGDCYPPFIPIDPSDIAYASWNQKNDGNVQVSPGYYLANAQYSYNDDGSSIQDISSNTFKINPSSSISVTSPNGGENWVRGKKYEIKWGYTGTPGSYVKIELLKAGVLVGIVTSSTPNDGSYNWTIWSGRKLGSDYKIRVTSTSNPYYTDTSDNYFTIGGINVISPNGGENWLRGVAHDIKWNSLGISGNVKIQLLKSGVVVGTVTSSTPNDGSFIWTIWSGRAIGSDYKIKVVSTSNYIYRDTSNNNFIIS